MTVNKIKKRSTDHPSGGSNPRDYAMHLNCLLWIFIVAFFFFDDISRYHSFSMRLISIMLSLSPSMIMK
jgi:hypothetical protein